MAFDYDHSGVEVIAAAAPATDAVAVVPATTESGEQVAAAVAAPTVVPAPVKPPMSTQAKIGLAAAGLAALYLFK
jgi:hypothetical protein